MENEIRRDTIRVTKKYDEILRLIQKNERIDNKADCYRCALDLYKQNAEISKELKENRDESKLLKESIEDLNFFIRTKLG